MGGNVLHEFLRLFYIAHYVALLYVFLIAPLAVLGGIIGKFIAFPFIVLAFCTPIGPVSIALQGIYLAELLASTLFTGRGLLLLAVVAALLFKTPVYVFLRRTMVAGRPAPLVLLIATLLTCTLSALGWRLFSALAVSLVVTTTMDLAVLSYAKYRDAVRGAAPRVWVPALALLWSSMTWLPVIASHGLWLNGVKHLLHPVPLAVVMAVWISITVVQVVVSVEYYRVAGGAHR